MKQNYITDSLVSLNKSQKPLYRLFCFPHAGGGCSTYSSWTEYCGEDIEIIVVQLPGRENRINEVPLDNLDIITELITHDISQFSDKPFAFFGHSLGSILSYEVCKTLLNNKKPYPTHLFLSSCRAPHIPNLDENKIYLLDDEQFTYRLKELNGTPNEILDIPEIRSLFFPMLRADFKIAETYYREINNMLPIPITCFMGQNDTVELDDLLEWEKHTNKSFSQHTFHGNHFYLKNNVDNIVKIIKAKLFN
ncbi:thioesterase [Virgibacillus pantothenticus]|uniref:thioesterase II family protein n=1 Tax=Virgibacillus pantothenticus TaxID=1473 RepID=UPI001C2398C5|nr:thioesterase domain-containing protein [Virgibacillus pantothenticus]MBU8567928.1 thioesterase [Virgibacillus pantothenticus]MBU8601812.1 thioesterase [Virgibacillus pantothenticus]MBU8635966.1 thioesterase [Virgibacillus pantothenticus]MBU8643650.1 thioesterase [Virgibacillus pantothenticus]MBU8647790.1 thioesterase [Virgibacillus pantothenticus]